MAKGSRKGKNGGGGLGKSDLPELQGSEKQIAWAKDLREDVYRNLENQYNAATKFNPKNPNESISKYGFPGDWWSPTYTKQESETIVKDAKKILDEGFSKITSAGAIINNRDYLSDLWKNALKQSAKKHGKK